MGFANVTESQTFTQTFQITNAPGGMDVFFQPLAAGQILAGPLLSQAGVTLSASIDNGIGTLDHYNELVGSNGSLTIQHGRILGPFHLADGNYTITETLTGVAEIGSQFIIPRRGTTASFNTIYSVRVLPSLVPEPTSVALLGLGLGTVLVTARRTGSRRPA